MSRTTAPLSLYLLLSLIGLSASSEIVPFFLEKFDSNPFDNGAWVKSKHEKYDNKNAMVIAASNSGTGFENDKGLQLTLDHRHYSLGASFREPLDVKGKNFILQYEVKFEDTLSCGGAYVKLPRFDKALNMAELVDSTPYTIMFGPDKCGSTNKVHLIMQHQNPITGVWEEKHAKDVPTVKVDKLSHLYTLAIRKDNTFEIFIDKESAKKGSLLVDMNPPVNPPKEIDDSTDSKPSEWVDNPKMQDPAAVKPDDWDESEPAMVLDESAVMPEGWLVDQPTEIPDPAAIKPADWDDEEDGEYEAPLVPNPACIAVGCGPWFPTKIKNPKYKGKWIAPMIDNPDYKGEWKPRQIPNPDYFEDLHPSNLAPMAGIAVEVWTTNAGIHFDNFLVDTDLSTAFAVADETFVPKQKAEKEKAKAEEKSQKEAARKDKLASDDGILTVLKVKLEEIADLVEENPITVFTSIFALLATSLLLCIWPLGSKKPKAVRSSPSTSSSGESSVFEGKEEKKEVKDTTEEKEEKKEEEEEEEED